MQITFAQKKMEALAASVDKLLAFNEHIMHLGAIAIRERNLALTPIPRHRALVVIGD